MLTRLRRDGAAALTSSGNAVLFIRAMASLALPTRQAQKNKARQSLAGPALKTL
jgi:hypothetical protein